MKWKQRICTLLSSDTQTGSGWQSLGTWIRAAQCWRCRAQPKVISFAKFFKIKKVSFLGGAWCRDTQRLQTFISSCGFVNLGLFLYLCTALPDKNTVLRREPVRGCGCSWRGLLRDHRHTGAGTCGMFACVWVVQTSPYPPWTDCNSRFS